MKETFASGCINFHFNSAYVGEPCPVNLGTSVSVQVLNMMAGLWTVWSEKAQGTVCCLPFMVWAMEKFCLLTYIRVHLGENSGVYFSLSGCKDLLISNVGTFEINSACRNTFWLSNLPLLLRKWCKLLITFAINNFTIGETNPTFHWCWCQCFLPNTDISLVTKLFMWLLSNGAKPEQHDGNSCLMLSYRCTDY